MVDQLLVAQEELQSTKKDLAAERAKAQEAREQVQSTATQLTTQRTLRQGTDINQVLARQRVGAQLSEANKEIVSREKQLDQFERDVIQPRQKEIDEIEQDRNDYNRALRVFQSTHPAAIFSLRNERQREYYRAFKAGQQDAITAQIASLEKQAARSFTPEIRQKLYDELKASTNTSKTPDQLNKNINQIITQKLPTFQPSQLQGTQSFATTTTQTANVVQPFNAPTGFFSGNIYKLNKFASGILTRQRRGEDVSVGLKAQRVGAQLGAKALMLGQNVANFPKAAVATAKSFIKNPRATAGGVLPSIRAQGAEIGYLLDTDPVGGVIAVGGFAAESYLLPKGIGKIAGRGLGAVETAAGFPRYNTVFVSKQAAQVGDDLFFQTAAKTQRTGLYGNRLFIAASESQIKRANVVGAEDDLFFKAATRGVSREQTFDAVTGRRAFTEPEAFGEMGFGRAKSTEITPVLGETEGIRVTTTPISATQIELTSAIANQGRKQTSFFVSKGFAVPVTDSQSLFFSSARQATKQASGKFLVNAKQPLRSIGVITNAAEETPTSLFFSKTTVQKSPTVQQAAEVTTQQAVQRGVEQTVKASREVKSTTAARALPSQQLTEQAQPTIVGGSGSPSSFAGQGTYERDQMTLATVPLITQDSFSIVTSKPFQGSSSGLAPAQRDRLLERLKTLQRQEGSLKNALGLKAAQAQASGTTQLLRSQQKTTTKQTARTNFATKVLGIMKKGEAATQSSMGTLSKEDFDTFDVITFKGGKKVVITVGLPKKRALKAGSDYVRSTLRASFKLQKSTRKSNLQDINFELPANVFTKSKKDPTRYVQRPGKRLASRSEVAEIMGTKRGRRKNRIL